jgi:2-keto-4-pentenoate hydratase
MNAWDDPRIMRGMEKQLARRRERIAAGEKPLGWKVGLGTTAAMERLKIKGPAVGYLMQSGLVDVGGSASIKGWVKPVMEPEIAVYMATDLPGSASREQAAAAVGALGPAIELADMEIPPDDVEVVLAANIFQRHVILGPKDFSRAGLKLDGLVSLLTRRGTEAARLADVQQNVGNILGVVQHVAGTLAACGEKLKAGDVIITGSQTPPVVIEPDESTFGYMLDPVGGIAVTVTR